MPFRAAQKHPANAVERVALAAAVAQGVVLHPAADLIGGAGEQPHDVKRVQHRGGVLEPAGQRGVVAPERVEGGDLHPAGERLALGVDPIAQNPTGAAFNDVEQPRRTAARRSQVDQPVANRVGLVAVAFKNAVSSTPSMRTSRPRAAASSS